MDKTTQDRVEKLLHGRATIQREMESAKAPDARVYLIDMSVLSDSCANTVLALLRADLDKQLRSIQSELDSL